MSLPSTSGKLRRTCLLSKTETQKRLEERKARQIESFAPTTTDDSGKCFLYAQLKKVYGIERIPENGRTALTCVFDQLDFTSEMPTANTGVLHFSVPVKQDFSRAMIPNAKVVVFGIKLPNDLINTANANTANYAEIFVNSQSPDVATYIVVESPHSRNLTSPVKDLPPWNKSGNYEYTSLNEICEPFRERYWIYGIITWFSYNDDRTKLEMTITDASLDVNKTVLCQLSSNYQGGALPEIHRQGDIIRLHRIAAQMKDNAICLYGRVGVFGLHAAVWDGASGGSLEPRKTSVNFSMTDKDETTVRALRQWYLDQSDQVYLLPDCVPVAHISTLSQLRRRNYANILVQVIGLSNSGRDHAVLRVWDGTCTPFQCWKMPTEETVWERLDETLNSIAMSLSVDVLVYDEHQPIAQLLNPGDLCMITNMHAYMGKTHNDLLCSLVVHGSGASHKRGLATVDPRTSWAKVLTKRLETFVTGHQQQHQTISETRPSCSAKTSPPTAAANTEINSTQKAALDLSLMFTSLRNDQTVVNSAVNSERSSGCRNAAADDNDGSSSDSSTEEITIGETFMKPRLRREVITRNVGQQTINFRKKPVL